MNAGVAAPIRLTQEDVAWLERFRSRSRIDEMFQIGKFVRINEHGERDGKETT